MAQNLAAENLDGAAHGEVPESAVQSRGVTPVREPLQLPVYRCGGGTHTLGQDSWAAQKRLRIRMLMRCYVPMVSG